MTVNWIKFRKNLISDGRVLIVSHKCHVDSVTVIGALVTLWCLADEYADKNGCLFGYTADIIDKEVGIVNFCESLGADWMDLAGEWVRLPDYQIHNGETAKKRAQATERKRLSRTMCDKSVTRIEENRIDKNIKHTDFSKPEKSLHGEEKLKKLSKQNLRTKFVPYEKIVDLYHKILPDLPGVAKLTTKRKTQIRKLWIEDLNNLENWANFFTHVSASDFLMGKSEPSPGHPNFRADIEWLTNQSNFTKIAEHKYHV